MEYGRMESSLNSLIKKRLTILRVEKSILGRTFKIN